VKIIRTPYIKPTRLKHDSGYRCFEIGYCDLDQKTKRAVNIEVLGTCTDHVWLQNALEHIKDLNLDLTTNGYIRIYGLNPNIIFKWEYEIPLSTMRIKQIEEVKK